MADTDDLSVGQLVETAAHINGWQKLRRLKRGASTLHSLSDGAELHDPDYDSGWFSVTTTTTYTKAHGLSSTPRHVEVWHSAVAAPSGSNELVLVSLIRNTSNVWYAPFGADGTNIYGQTEDATAGGTVYSKRRTSNTGYWRFLAWV